jgi:hypothetical protein
MCWCAAKRLSTHSREKRKLYERWVVGASIGAGAGVSEAAGLSSKVESLDNLIPFTFAVLPAFSFSLIDGAGLFDFAACFEPPPMRLRRMLHLPLPGSSSGKSCESVDIAEAGRGTASGILLLVGDGFRW